MQLHELTLSEMLAAIEAGRCEAVEIAQSCLDRIAALEPAVGAWTHLEERAAWLERWRHSEARHRDLPFKGLPLGVKDTIDVAGLKAERGSSIWADRIATEDAACVARLKSAGLHVTGKTVTTEFAYFKPGKTANPCNLAHTPGGSSSGSAAAVAAAMVPVALGTQTAGSLIRPASYCGVAGYVASVGLFSLRGVMPLAWSFDAPGVLARSVEDLQRLHYGLCGEPFDALAPEQAATTLLAIDGRAFGEVEPAMLDAFESALRQLAAHGVRIRRPREAHSGASWPRLQHRLMACEAAQTLAFESTTSRDGLSARLCDLVDEGRAIGFDEVSSLRAQRETARAELQVLRAGCEAIIAPAASGAAPAGLGATGALHLSRPWQLFGLPQVTLPLTRDARGLPLGVQIIGLPRGDRPLLRLARWLEREMGWRSGA
jgi:Asp-tRNA(Asn)/Glu-tRNA(Gln) amidotransferase A subunit family amidase